ncbi:hypothetical protein [Algirhabdus cladophorae]|uniref:hypothetical protein n=1 Tax=Algirhabdus cladophorae TaxID=3377108 RepID=UPI003B84ABF7
MTNFTLTKTRFQEGVWEGLLSSEGSATGVPKLRVTHLDRVVDEVEVIPNEGEWIVRVHVPATAIADGVHTILVTDASSDTVLNSLTLISGNQLEEDIRAEVDLLRSELDMLKRAFRRHCLETM